MYHSHYCLPTLQCLQVTGFCLRAAFDRLDGAAAAFALVSRPTEACRLRENPCCSTRRIVRSSHVQGCDVCELRHCGGMAVCEKLDIFSDLCPSLGSVFLSFIRVRVVVQSKGDATVTL